MAGPTGPPLTVNCSSERPGPSAHADSVTTPQTSELGPGELTCNAGSAPVACNAGTAHAVVSPSSVPATGASAWRVQSLLNSRMRTTKLVKGAHCQGTNTGIAVVLWEGRNEGTRHLAKVCNKISCCTPTA